MHPEQQTLRETKYMKLIEDFNTALSRACEAGEALQDCYVDEKRKALDTCLLETEGDCLEERRDYKEKCEELIKYEKHLKEAYEKEYTNLKESLREMEMKRQTSEREHKNTVEEMEQKHNELTRNISLQADLQKLQDQASAAANLTEMKQSYQDKQEEVEGLRSKLAEKEKALYELGDQIEMLEKKVKIQLMIVDKEHMEEQLRTCVQIEDMLSHLPDIDCEKIYPLVKDISAAVEEMKGKAVNKRAVSWRQ